MSEIEEPTQATEWVLVETCSTFKIQYLVEVPVGKSNWALDTVAMEEAKECSQEHLGEQIFSHRVVSKAEALTLCDTANDYTTGWSEQEKTDCFFNKINDYNGIGV